MGQDHADRRRGPRRGFHRQWFGAGIVAAGMGSKLVTDAAVKAGDWAAIETSVRAAVGAVAAFRATKG